MAIRTARVLAMVVACSIAASAAYAQGHGSHPPMPGQEFELRCRLVGIGEPREVVTPLHLPSVSSDALLNQRIDLPQPQAALRVLRFLARAKVEQSVTPTADASGAPAVRIVIQGPSQEYERWLAADDADRNRLISLIGTWRFMAVASAAERDELYQKFEHELTRPPVLRVRREKGDATLELEARVGVEHLVDDPACTLVVREFLPDFVFDRETGEPTRRSDSRLNPAALVEIRTDRKTEKRWVFSRFPDFAASEDVQIPIEVVLDCPLEKKRSMADFALVSVARAAPETWLRHNDRVRTFAGGPGQIINVPETNYTFRIAGFVPSGRLTETYESTAERGAVTALEVEVVHTDGRTETVWLTLDGERVIADASGARLTLWFGPRVARPGSTHAKTP